MNTTAFTLVMALFLQPPLSEPDWTGALLKIAGGDLEGAATKLKPCRGTDCARAELLLGLAELAAGRPERAEAAFRRAEKLALAGSFLAGKAAFGLAECQAARKNFKKAEEVFSGALSGLLSAERRGKIADRLLRLAEEKLQPPAGVEAQPTVAEALLRAALRLKPDTERQDQLRLRLGESLSRQNRHQESAEYFRRSARRCARLACKHEALWQAAREYLAANNLQEARRQIFELLEAAPPRGLEEKARYLLARTWGFPSPKRAKDLFDGLKALEEFVKLFPDSRRAERARLTMGLAPLRAGYLSLAADALRSFLEKGQTEQWLAEARYFLGESLFKQELYQQAIETWQRYSRQHPSGRHWLAAREGVERATWKIAEIAAREKKWPQALEKFQALAADWPASPKAPQALLEAARAARECGNLALSAKILEDLTRRFVDSEEACRGWYELGRLNEEREDFVAARRNYQKAASCPKGAVSEASASLTLLEKPWLAVEALGVFRIGKPVEVTLHSRNLQSISLDLYRIQAEDFFRDRRNMEMLTMLDVGLCRPDRSLQVKVEGARPHARLTQKVRLPVEAPGLYLLRLSAAGLEATTAVRVSNLEVVLKTTASQIFVFAEDAAHGRPREGVKVLVADDTALLGEGHTDRQGGFSLELSESSRPENIRVLALDGDQPAFAHGDSFPESPPNPRLARALVFSDRPAYRPGETVRLAGLVRNRFTSAGLPAFRAGDKPELSVTSPDGLTLLREKVGLDDYGIFDAALPLDGRAPEGMYAVALADATGSIASGFFQVQKFNPLPFEIIIMPDRLALRQGEPFSGIILLRHLGGGPAADLSLEYRLGTSGAWTSARSDQSGQVRFSVPTRELQTFGKLKFCVRLPAINLEKALEVLVAERQLKIALSTARGTLIAGQPFDLRLKVSAQDGSPQRAEVALEIILRTSEGERRVWEKKVSVGEGGEGRVPVTVERGGRYFARALTEDADGRPVFSEISFSVEEAQKPVLRMDVEQAVLSPGQPVRLSLESKQLPGLVLLCAETDRVLKFLPVSMQEERQHLEFVVPPEVSERFLLTAVMLEGKNVHRSVREIEIDRRIRLKVQSDRQVYRPGEEVSLTVTASDGQGRPADVGVVLAVVDEALYQVFPDTTASLFSVFVPQREFSQPALFTSNEFEFPEAEAEPVTAPEITEAEGSAVMAALSAKRKDITARAAADFGKLTGATVGEALGIGGLGTGGGGGGYGRGLGSAAVRMGKADVVGRAPLRQSLAMTAAFFPHLSTGKHGKTRVSFRLPDNVTTWRVTGRAISRSFEVGETRSYFEASLPLQVEAILPPELTSGTRLRPGARLINSTGEPEQVALTLELAGQRFSRNIAIGPRQMAEHFFESMVVPAAEAGELEMELSATGRVASDRLRRKVPLREPGFEEQVRLTGRLEKSAVLELEIPPEWRRPRLSLGLDSRLARLLSLERFDPVFFTDRPELALILLELWNALGHEGESTQLDLLAERLRETLYHLGHCQQDGGLGAACLLPAEPMASARLVRALARVKPIAGRIGYVFPEDRYRQAIENLVGQLGKLTAEDDRERAEIFYALASTGKEQVPDALLAGLDRRRGELGLEAQALLGLGWLALGRPEKAAEMAEKVKVQLSATDGGGEPLLSTAGARALQLLAAVYPADPQVAAQGARLLSGGGGLFFCHPALAEAALGAIVELLKAPGAGGRLRVSVSLNDSPEKTVELFPGPKGTAHLEIEPALLRTGKNRLLLSLAGTGAAFYSVRLSGWRTEAPAASPLELRRWLEPVPRPYRGHEIEAGYRVVSELPARRDRAIDAIEAGRVVEAKIQVPAARPGQHLLLLEIPDGFDLIENRRQFEGVTHLLRQGRKLAFLVNTNSHPLLLHVRLRALFPGEFRLEPVQLLSLREDRSSSFVPSGKITVLPPGVAAPEPPPTPDELQQMGSLAAKEKEHRDVVKFLEELWSQYRLQPEVARETLGLLLTASLELGDEERMVKYFEQAKEKNSSLVVPFEKLAALQRAYRNVGSFEAGLQLERASADAELLRELHALGVLEEQGELAEALELFREQLDAFPESDTLSRAVYGLGQVVFLRADEARENRPPVGFDRRSLLGEAAGLIARFIAFGWKHPQMPEAAYSVASALLEQDVPSQAVAWCQTAVRREPDSDYSAALRYLSAYALFRQGRYDESLKLCRQVIEDSEKSGEEENRQMATYIMAQILHARGQVSEALKLYRQVAGRFRDAAETVAESEREFLRVDPVYTPPTGKRAVLEVELRNIRELSLRAYPVDPMRLALLKGGIASAGGVNLSGIRPTFARTVRLPPNPGVLQREKVELTLPGKGAYLVLLRGGSRTAQTLVLLGGLRVEILPSSSGERLRIAVTRQDGSPAADARVQLKDEGERFLVGKADLRGIFLADNVQGRPGVVAEKDGAFGVLLGAPAEPEEDKAESDQTTYEFESDQVEGDLVEPAGDLKQAAQKARQFFKQKSKGVSAEQAK